MLKANNRWRYSLNTRSSQSTSVVHHSLYGVKFRTSYQPSCNHQIIATHFKLFTFTDILIEIHLDLLCHQIFSLGLKI